MSNHRDRAKKTGSRSKVTNSSSCSTGLLVKASLPLSTFLGAASIVTLPPLVLANANGS
jgi:hypothetical protein